MLLWGQALLFMLMIPHFCLSRVAECSVSKEKSLNLAVINDALEATLSTPAFVDVDNEKKSGKYVRLPERAELNSEINELLVVEYYNR